MKTKLWFEKKPDYIILGAGFMGIFFSWVLWNYTNHPVVLLIVGLCTLPVAFLHGKELSNDTTDRKESS